MKERYTRRTGSPVQSRLSAPKLLFYLYTSGKYNNCSSFHDTLNIVPNPKKPRTPCLVCRKEPARSFYKYCSNACQAEFQYQQYIREWKAGTVSGLRTTGVVTRQIKRYLREKYGNKCHLCKWSEVNPYTGVVPLVADHIDGNWRNNAEKNIRLVCPNCDALSPTFANLNKGKGRPGRTRSNRAREARGLA